LLSEKWLKKKTSCKNNRSSIYRAENGLALSSRNQRLHEDRKEASKIIYETLKKVNDWFRTVTIPEIKERVADIFDNQQGMKLEYFLIADEKTLQETDSSIKTETSELSL
jgi:pantoate--beta-alanine ligase